MSPAMEQDDQNLMLPEDEELDGIEVMPKDDESNEFEAQIPNALEETKPESAAGRSFGANETAMTFIGVYVEGAIDIDHEEGTKVIQIQTMDIEDTEADKKSKKPPKQGQPPRANRQGKKFEVGKRQMHIEEQLDEPLPEIQLTAEEAKVLKRCVFRDLENKLDSAYRKVANKEVN